MISCARIDVIHVTGHQQIVCDYYDGLFHICLWSNASLDQLCNLWCEDTSIENDLQIVRLVRAIVIIHIVMVFVCTSHYSNAVSGTDADAICVLVINHF